MKRKPSDLLEPIQEGEEARQTGNHGRVRFADDQHQVVEPIPVVFDLEVVAAEVAEFQELEKPCVRLVINPRSMIVSRQV